MKLLLCLLLALTTLVPQGATVDKTAWELPDLETKTHCVLPAGEAKVSVLLFVSPYCPTSNTFAPEINRITEDYQGRAAFFLLHADPAIKTTDAYQHAVMFKIKATVLLDAEQKITQKVGATITPEAVVLGPEGQVLYQGRINDLYLGPTKRQRQATTRDLRDALDAALGGKPPAVARTEAMGCKIPRK